MFPDSQLPAVVAKLYVDRRSCGATLRLPETPLASPTLIRIAPGLRRGRDAGLAERYRQHRWVRWVVYGLAGGDRFSRVPTFAHFPSDVFGGAALGYTITRFDVLRDRTH